MKSKIVVIDGQGGKIGSMIIAQIKLEKIDCKLFAIGTNSIATSNMIKAGADCGATGENPVIVNCADADIIVGSIGIVTANSLMGEITPNIAISIGKSNAQKVLIPMNRCGIYVVGTQNLSISEQVDLAIKHIISIAN